MKAALLVSLLVLGAPALEKATSAAAAGPQEAPRDFGWIEVWIDSGADALAAWQVDVRITSPDARIAGIEGGDPAAFREPPTYDPRALRGERAVLAAFSTAPAEGLPRGRVRLATIHVELPAGATPQATITLEAAADPEGRRLAPLATIIGGR
jgi:hypothetical protein